MIQIIIEVDDFSPFSLDHQPKMEEKNKNEQQFNIHLINKIHFKSNESENAQTSKYIQITRKHLSFSFPSTSTQQHSLNYISDKNQHQKYIHLF